MRGIYEWRNRFTDTVYYGQSVNIEQRKKRHICNLRNNKHDNNYLQDAWNKYGEDAFIFSIVEIVEDLSISLTPIEQRYYDSTINRYNEVPPGDPPSWSPEIRKKISEALKGKKHSLETKRKMSEARMGDKNPNFGKKASAYALKRNSEAHKGNTNTLGYITSRETKQKLSLAMKQCWANRTDEQRKICARKSKRK